MEWELIFLSRDKDGCTPNNVRLPMVFIVFSMDSWGLEPINTQITGWPLVGNEGMCIPIISMYDSISLIPYFSGHPNYITIHPNVSRYPTYPTEADEWFQ